MYSVVIDAKSCIVEASRREDVDLNISANVDTHQISSYTEIHRGSRGREETRVQHPDGSLKSLGALSVVLPDPYSFHNIVGELALFCSVI